MSTVIDERVVEMKFNNSDFEKHAKESMSTLEKLKSALNLEGAGKSLSDLSRQAATFSLDGIGNAADAVGQKFSAFSTIAIGALLKIGEQAVQTGEQMIKSLTIDPIKTGFQEFEQNMDSVQTIMAGTGESLDVVQGKLDELNHYADRTIYSFSDMTANIGKFTNAGVGLDDAVAAIQGIANEAAVSGANAQQASHAMYNFAQALSSGYVKLIDWKSIENANMATVEFKQQLIDTAVAMGTLVKEGDKYKTTTTNAQGKVSDLFNATLGFNDALQNQWMTSEVLTKTLAKYADETTDIGKKAFAAAQDIKTFTQMYDTLKEAAQSGWSESFRIIVGDFEEGKSLWTAVGKEIGGILDAMSDERNTLLREWKEGGGRNEMISAFKNIWNALKSIITPIKEAFRDIFPKTTSKQLIETTKKIEQFTKKLILSKDTAGKLKDIFTALFTVLKKIGTAFKNVAKAMKPTIDTIKDLGNRLFNFIADSAKLLTTGGKLEELGGIFSDSFNGVIDIADILNTVKDSITDFIDTTKKRFDTWGGGLTGAIAVVTGVLDDVTQNILSFIETVTGLDLSNFKKEVKDNILGAFTDMRQSIDDAKKKIQEFKDNITKTFNEGGGGLSGVFNVTLDIVGTLSDGILDVISRITGWDVDDIKKKISEAIDKIKAKITELSESVKNITTMNDELITTESVLNKIKETVGKFVDSISSAFTKITDKIAENPFLSISAVMAFFKGKETLETINSLKDFVDSMTDFVKNFGSIGKNIKDGLGTVKDALNDFSTTLKIDGIVKIATAIAILTGSLYVLSTVTFGTNFAANVGLLSVMLGECVGALELMSKTMNTFDAKRTEDVTSAIIKMSGAMAIMGYAVKEFASVETDKVASSIILIVASMAALVGAMVAIDKLDVFAIGKTVQTAMIAMAGALALIAHAISELQGMEPEDVLIMAGALVLSLAAIVKAMEILGETDEKGKAFIKTAKSTSTAMLAMGASILMIAQALNMLRDYDPDQLLSSFIALGTMMAGFVEATRWLGNVSLTTSVAIIAMAASMLVIAKALQMLNESDPAMLVASMTILSMSLFAMAGAMAMLKNIGPAGLAASAGIVLIAVALGILANAMIKLSELELEKIGTSCLALVVPLIAMTAALAVLSNNSAGMMAAGIALVLVAGSLLLVSQAVQSMSEIGFDQMIDGLAGIGGAIVILCTALALSKNNMAGAAALLVASGAIVAIGYALQMLNGIENVVELLLPIAGGIAAIAIASKQMENSMKGAAALTLASASIVAIAYALQLLDGVQNTIPMLVPLAAGLAAIALASKAMEKSIAGAAALTLASVAVIAMAGAFKLMEGLDMMTMLGQMLAVAAGLALLAGAAMLIQPALPALGILVGGVLLVIAGLAGVLALVALSIGLMAEKLAELAISGPAASEALSLLGSALKSYGSAFAAAAVYFLPLAGGLAAFGAACLVTGAGIIVLGAGLAVFAVGLLAAAGAIAVFLVSVDAFKEKADQLGKDIPEMIASAVDNVINFINRLAEIIDEKTPELIAAVKKLMTSIKKAAIEVLTGLGTDFKKAGKNAVQGFINGIKSLIGKVGEAASSIAKTAANKLKSFLGIHSPSKLFEQFGQYTDQGLINGLLSFRDKVGRASEKVGSSAVDGMTNALNYIYDSVNDEVDMNPVISPVIDLTDAKKRAGELDTMLTRNKVSDISAGFDSNRYARQKQDEANRAGLLNQLSGITATIKENPDSEPTPVNVTVTLDGDSGKIFNVVRTENDRFKKSTGKSALT